MADSPRSPVTNKLPPVAAGWLALGGFLLFALVWFALQFHITARRPLAIAGMATAVIVLAGWAAVLRRWRLEHALQAHDVLAPAEVDQSQPSIAPDELPVIADAHEAAARALAQLEHLGKHTTPSVVLPTVLLIRVGRGVVDVLLSKALEHAPEGTELSADGRSLRLLTQPEPVAVRDPSSLLLTELGADRDGVYFAPSDRVVMVPNDDVGRHVAVGEDPALVVVLDGADVVVEPFGLRLAAPPTHLGEWSGAEARAEIVPDDAFDDRFPEAGELPEVPPEEDASGEESTEGEASSNWLVPPGPVEVRILREEPDLLGDLLAPPDRPAIEFVAYLATHSHRAATARLRDALGTAKSQRSRSGKTVWSAAGSARTCLGEARVPPASGSQPYVLAEEVTCDWGRFQALVRLARSATDDVGVTREALTQALSLVEGVPAAASQRFSWLDGEHFLSDIATAVVTASAELAELCLASLDASDDRELATWAIKKGRLLEPRAQVLAELEDRLAHQQARA